MKRFGFVLDLPFGLSKAEFIQKLHKILEEDLPEDAMDVSIGGDYSGYVEITYLTNSEIKGKTD